LRGFRVEPSLKLKESMNNAFIILAQLDESSTIEEALASFQANK